MCIDYQGNKPVDCNHNAADGWCGVHADQRSGQLDRDIAGRRHGREEQEDMQVRCVKAGWQDRIGNIPSNFEGWTVGNVLIGGIIGLGVDAATGAMNEYPHAFQVPMTKKDAASSFRHKPSDKSVPTS